MGMESGFSGDLEPQRAPELPLGGEVKVQSNKDVEQRADSSWLAELVNPDRLERVRQYPAYTEGSAEYALFEILEADLNEKGADMDPAKRARLRNLVGVLRMLFYPNLTEQEQGYSNYILQEVDHSTSTYEVTRETRDDVRWIYSTFGLAVPTTQQLGSLPPVVSRAIAQIGLNQA